MAIEFVGVLNSGERYYVTATEDMYYTTLAYFVDLYYKSRITTFFVDGIEYQEPTV